MYSWNGLDGKLGLARINFDTADVRYEDAARVFISFSSNFVKSCSLLFSLLLFSDAICRQDGPRSNSLDVDVDGIGSFHWTVTILL